MLSRNFHVKYCCRCNQYTNGQSPECETERTNFKANMKKVAIGITLGTAIIIVARLSSSDEELTD